jgi:hypothetical protein
MLIVVCITAAIGGAIVSAAGVFVGYRLGRRAAIGEEGIRQAREARDRIVSEILLDGSVKSLKLADGAVVHYRVADGAVKPS